MARVAAHPVIALSVAGSSDAAERSDHSALHRSLFRLGGPRRHSESDRSVPPDAAAARAAVNPSGDLPRRVQSAVEAGHERHDPVRDADSADSTRVKRHAEPRTHRIRSRNHPGDERSGGGARDVFQTERRG